MARSYSRAKFTEFQEIDILYSIVFSDHLPVVSTIRVTSVDPSQVVGVCDRKEKDDYYIDWKIFSIEDILVIEKEVNRKIQRYLTKDGLKCQAIGYQSIDHRKSIDKFYEILINSLESFAA